MRGGEGREEGDMLVGVKEEMNRRCKKRGRRRTRTEE